ncbi:DEAD/DEAH box helicase [Fructobacillus sp. M2-14]|uniref:DEAD/DEAH box helicase n=1 Tax=Fructobacillus broussonetiae TaxID=2713173 RepID=A0ABS5R0P4_9LACO|nr:DEAD/DEAH box helicase [Fructobacillus broussonetiae]MBS9338782.1 DEAD/DEAH box helicase [Fructobacillus broussonetiae]
MILPELTAEFDKNFKAKTPIQEALFERLSEGESLFGLAPTGSGKTLAFALPLLSRLDLSKKGHQLLILAPSQELGAQLAQVIRPYAALIGVKVAALIGGANGKRQADKLKKEKPAVVVGTLGRIQTMIDGKALKTNNFSMLVVDEADATLTDEHKDDLEKLADNLPNLKQVTLFSATSGVNLAWVQELFGQSVKPVSVGQQSPKEIAHTYLHVDARSSHKVLIELARRHVQALVFFNSINALVAAQAALRHEHASVMSVGNNEKSHLKRADALQAFKKGKLDLLLATDVAGRGLDISGLPLVVNAQVPRNLTAYLHRSGRTGRAGMPGQVLMLGNGHDIRLLKQYLPDELELDKFSWASVDDKKTKAASAARRDRFADWEDDGGKEGDDRVADELAPRSIASTKKQKPGARSQVKRSNDGASSVKRPGQGFAAKKAAARKKNDPEAQKKVKQKHQARKKKNKGKPKWAQKRD